MDLNEIRIEDYEKLKYYFGLRHPQTSDSALFNLFMWNNCYEQEYFVTEKGLFFLSVEDGTYITAPPLCKNQDLRECFLYIQDYFNNQLKSKLRMFHVDLEALKLLNLSEEDYIINEETDYADYIYNADNLKKLAGAKYHKKKNHVNSFKKKYKGRYQYKQLTEKNYNEIMEMLGQWVEDKEGVPEYEYLECEEKGIRYLLKNTDTIECKIGGVYVDGKLEAFSIGTYGTVEKTAYIHIEKANSNIGGLYAYINMKFLKEEFPDAVYVNREDDMGLSGLRQAKQSYRPAYMLRKFSVIQR